MIQTVSQLTFELAKLFGTEQFIVHSTLAIVLTSLICGGVGSLVVGNRMAFFSDALAHCAIAGMTLGLIVAPQAHSSTPQSVISSTALLVTVGFGAMVGIGIAYVREKTGLASDTVIGVFFAGALGIGAVLFGFLKQVSNVDPEMILFGSPTYAAPLDMLRLAGLLALTAVAVYLRYNQLVFASFNPSLARSRRIPLRLYNVGSSRVDLQACKLEYSIVSPK